MNETIATKATVAALLGSLIEYLEKLDEAIEKSKAGDLMDCDHQGCALESSRKALINILARHGITTERLEIQGGIQ